MRGGMDPGEIGFRPLIVEVVDMWRDLLSRDEALLSPGSAGFMAEPQPISDRPIRLGPPHRAGWWVSQPISL